MIDSARRLDAFTDAAFAFAVTLLLVGGSAAPADYAALVRAMQAIPSFAIGFAIIGMFWYAHVQWRAYRGEGDGRSVLLTFLLVFIVLVYVYPLRATSQSFASFLAGAGGGVSARELGGIFAIYGAGFAAMAAVVGLLYLDALRNPDLNDRERHDVRGSAVTWFILVATGVASAILSSIAATRILAPWLYATLPLTIGVFHARWRRAR